MKNPDYAPNPASTEKRLAVVMALDERCRIMCPYASSMQDRSGSGHRVQPVYGVTTDDELVQVGKTLIEDPQFNPAFREFADFSQITELRVTSDGVAAIIGARQPFPPQAMRAFFAPQDVVFGMARMFELRHAESGLLVTRSREAAEQHIGLASGESLLDVV